MKLKKLFLLCTFALYALITTGCFDVGRVATLTFVQTPQSIYYVVGSEEAMVAQQEVLENVIVKVDDNEYTLKALRDLLGATVEGLNLTDEGTHTLVIKFEGATLTYVYKVVTNLGATLFAGGDGKTPETAYQIATPEQFMNMFFRVYGIAAPAKLTEPFDETIASHMDAERNWKTYYQACFPFFTTGVYYKLIADLDFDGIEFVPLGALGGENYIPFTGTIDGTNKAIKNVTVSPVGDASSIFAGIYGATIKNLNIDNFQCDVNNFTKYAGSLSSFVFGDESLIENVHVTNSQIFAQRAGGLLSDGNTFIVKNCSVDDKTIIASVQHGGAVSAKNQKDRSFSYYLLTFNKLGNTPEFTIKNVNYAGGIYSFVIDGFNSLAKFYTPETTQIVDGLFSSGSGPKADDRFCINALAQTKLDPVTDGATPIYLGLISYTSIYTDGSNRVIVLPNETVYNAWKIIDGVPMVVEFYTPSTKNDPWNHGTDKAFVDPSDRKVKLDNRLFIYDADGFVGIELYNLKHADDQPGGIYKKDGKFKLFFKDGKVCGIIIGTTVYTS